MSEYKLKGNPVIDVPVVGDLIYDDLGKEVLAKHIEKFKESPVVDNHKYDDGEPLSYSNTPRVLSYNQILRGIDPSLHVLSPEEVVQYWNSLPDRDDSYADTNSVAVYPNEGPNENLRKRVLELLGKEQTELPLTVSGLGVEPSDNEQGFNFTETDNLQAKEAHYLEQDGKVIYDLEKGLIQSDEGVRILIPDSQNGLRRLYRGRSVGLNARGDYLLNAVDAGRVQIAQNFSGNIADLEAKLKYLEGQKTEQIEEIEMRYKKSANYLKTGNFD
jgi:hypothetical protein